MLRNTEFNFKSLNKNLNNGDLVLITYSFLGINSSNYALCVGYGEFYTGFCVLKGRIIPSFKVENPSEDEKLIYEKLILNYNNYLVNRLRHNRLNKVFGDTYLYMDNNINNLYVYLYSDKKFDYFYSFSLTFWFNLLYDIDDADKVDLIDLFYGIFNKDVKVFKIEKDTYKKKINADTYLGKLFFCDYFSFENYFKYIERVRKLYFNERSSLRNISFDKSDLKRRRTRLLNRYNDMIKKIVFSVKSNDFSELNKSSVDLLFKYLANKGDV